ncbi:hypothetical protein [Streptomyces sp. NPDC059783]|uniref:hypothetical protein n=1 Tax=Streptomyces sp. NPDC059783 TaxID=3346944 RepID=UPI00365FBE11
MDQVVNFGRTAHFFLDSDLPTLVLPTLVLRGRVLRDVDQTAGCLLASGPLTTAQLDERLRDLGHDFSSGRGVHALELARCWARSTARRRTCSRRRASSTRC